MNDNVRENTMKVTTSRREDEMKVDLLEREQVDAFFARISRHRLEEMTVTDAEGSHALPSEYLVPGRELSSVTFGDQGDGKVQVTISFPDGSWLEGNLEIAHMALRDE